MRPHDLCRGSHRTLAMFISGMDGSVFRLNGPHPISRRPGPGGPAPSLGLRWGLRSHSGQYLSQESYQRIERVEASGLPRHHMLDAPDEVPVLDIGLRVELEDKRTLWGQEGFLRGRNFMRLTLSLSHTHNVFFLLMTPAAYQQP